MGIYIGGLVLVLIEDRHYGMDVVWACIANAEENGSVIYFLWKNFSAEGLLKSQA